MPEVTLSELDGVRFLHLGSPWVQGAMRIRKPFKLELEYIQRMMAWLLMTDLDELPGGRCLQLGMGSAALTKFCWKQLGMSTEVVELNPQVVEVCRNWFCLPPDDDRLTVHVQDAAKFVQDSNRHGRYRAISVDLYDHDAAAPVLDHAEFYADCAALLEPGGVMTVNVFGWASHYGSSVTAIGEGFGVPTGEAWMYSLKPTKEGNTVIMVVKRPADAGAEPPDRASLLAKAERVKEAFELPAEKWVKVLRRLEVEWVDAPEDEQA